VHALLLLYTANYNPVANNSTSNMPNIHLSRWLDHEVRSINATVLVVGLQTVFLLPCPYHHTTIMCNIQLSNWVDPESKCCHYGLLRMGVHTFLLLPCTNDSASYSAARTTPLITMLNEAPRITVFNEASRITMCHSTAQDYEVFCES
jgi:hypothetical protein